MGEQVPRWVRVCSLSPAADHGQLVVTVTTDDEESYMHFLAGRECFEDLARLCASGELFVLRP